MTARPADARRLAARLWDLPAWSDRALDLAGRGWQALPPDRPEVLAPGFELSAAVLRHLQADPLLPEELLPAVAGPSVTGRLRRWDMRYRGTLAEWSRATGTP